MSKNSVHAFDTGLKKQKVIGFLENKLTPRGTSITVYDMAHYNETILNNKSFIITRPYYLVKSIDPIDVTLETYKTFESRFKMIYYITPADLQQIVIDYGLDLLFIEKSGVYDDGLIVNNCKTLIHAVFESRFPHGTYYCTISDTVNKYYKTNVPVLPYMVNVHDSQENLRNKLNIPNDAVVFGCYGGEKSFDHLYTQKIVKDVSVNNPGNIYFIFMNINAFCETNKYVKFLPGTTDTLLKRKFINTCDAMLYGRDDGETFGLACGEFSLCDKPVICSNIVIARSHLDILGYDAITHSNYEQLKDIILNFKEKYNKSVVNNKYKEYTPEKVMTIFNNIISS